jgi:hypothetical protein
MASLKMTPVSEGHTPKGAHGRAAVRALGRTKTTGNFKKIEAAKGKGAAIAAYQNKLKAHQGAEHNGPTAHVGKSGMHYGAHEGHNAITSQEGSCCC